jgi:hypothetical protein
MKQSDRIYRTKRSNPAHVPIRQDSYVCLLYPLECTNVPAWERSEGSLINGPYPFPSGPSACHAHPMLGHARPEAKEIDTGIARALPCSA